MAWDSHQRQAGAMSPLMSPIMSPTMSPLSTNFADMDNMINFDLNTPGPQTASVNGFNLSKSHYQHRQLHGRPLSPLPTMSPAMRPSTSRSNPSMVVKVHIQFADPMPYYHSRSYPSSRRFQPDEKLCKALGRRIDHCMREVITRRDLGALESRRNCDGTQKSLRFEATFQICLKTTGVWSTQTYRSYQKIPLDRDSARDTILAVHRIIGLFMRRHDDEFVWIAGPVKEDFPSHPETTHPIHGAPLPLTCIPRSRFIETTQSFETIPGFTMELDFSSRCRRRQPGPWVKTLRVNSRQGTPLTLPIAEEFLWKVHRVLNNALDDRKWEFDKKHATCNGLEGYGQCQHFEEDAFLIEVALKNNLGPDYNHLSRKVKTNIIMFPDPEFRDVEQFIESLKPSLVEARDAADAAIAALSDFDFKVLEVRGRGWFIARPISLKISSESSYSRSSVEAILDRIQTAIDYVIDGHDIICRMIAHKRGHLILDKTLLAQRERGIRRNDPGPKLEKKEFVTKLENQVRQEVAMVCQQTTSTSEDLPLPEFEIYSAPQISDDEEALDHEASVEKFYPIHPEDAPESLGGGQDTASTVSEYESLSETPRQDFSAETTNIPDDDTQFKVVVDSNGKPIWVEVENGSVSNVTTEEVVPEVQLDVKTARETPIATQTEDVDANLKTPQTIPEPSPKTDISEEVPAQVVIKPTPDLALANDLETITPSLASTKRLDFAYRTLAGPHPNLVAYLPKRDIPGKPVGSQHIVTNLTEELSPGPRDSSAGNGSSLSSHRLQEPVSDEATDEHSPAVTLKQLMVKVPSDTRNDQEVAPVAPLVDKGHEHPVAVGSIHPAKPVLPVMEGVNSELEGSRDDTVRPTVLRLVPSYSSENFPHQVVKRAESEASVASNVSMYAPSSDSVPSTPSLSKSSPHGTSPNNSILFTPQYFTTRAAHRLFEVHIDGLEHEHSHVEPAESPILSTKRHSTLLALESHGPLRTDLRSGDAHFILPSPTESSASGFPDYEVQSPSSSQPTARPALDISVKPSNEELESIETSEAQEEPLSRVEIELAKLCDVKVRALSPDQVPIPLDDSDPFDLPESDVEDNLTPKRRHSQRAPMTQDSSEYGHLLTEVDTLGAESDSKFHHQIPEMMEAIPVQISLPLESGSISKKDEPQPTTQLEVTSADKCTPIIHLQDVATPIDDILPTEAENVGVSLGSEVDCFHGDVHVIDASPQGVSVLIEAAQVSVDSHVEGLPLTAQPCVQPSGEVMSASCGRAPCLCDGSALEAENQVHLSRDLETTVTSQISTDNTPLLTENELSKIDSEVELMRQLSPEKVPFPSIGDDDDLLDPSGDTGISTAPEGSLLEQPPNPITENSLTLPDGIYERSIGALEHLSGTIVEQPNDNFVLDPSCDSTNEAAANPSRHVTPIKPPGPVTLLDSQLEQQIPRSIPELSEPEGDVFEDDGSVLEQLSEMSRNSCVGHYDLSDDEEQSVLLAAPTPITNPTEVRRDTVLLEISPSTSANIGDRTRSGMPPEYSQKQMGFEDTIAPGAVLSNPALLTTPPLRPILDNDQTPTRKRLTLGIPFSPKTVLDLDELTPRGPPQISYFSLDPSVPEKLGDASPIVDSPGIAFPPLHREASSIYSYSTSNVSTISSMEPKTSYELLDINDMPTSPEPHSLPPSAGYLGLHEEKRVKVDLRGAILGPFRNRATNSRPSSSGSILAGHGREKGEKKHWWGRKRNTSMDITTSIRMSPQAKKEGAIRPHTPGSSIDTQENGEYVEISATQPDVTDSSSHQEVEEMPRASFASSRTSGISATAHLTTEVKDDRPVSRLMMVFAGVTIASSLFAKSGHA